MGLGIGLGRDWLSGRYAVPFVCSVFARKGKNGVREGYTAKGRLSAMANIRRICLC